MAAPALASERVTVENAQLRMVFDTTPVPGMRELVHKPSGTNLLAGAAVGPMFALQLASPQGAGSWVESQQAKTGTVTLSPGSGGQRIHLTFDGLGPSGDLGVALDGQLDDAEPFVRWSITLVNPSGLRLKTVRFPCVSAVPEIGAPDDDFLIGPALPGVMIENPGANWPADYSIAWAYPGDQSMQFCSYQDRSAGVYLASMDTLGHGRSLNIAKHGQRMILSQDYQLAGAPVARWESPYATALGVTSGPWQQTADLYKRWAVRQAWCAQTLAQRADIPAYWLQGPCIHTCEVRTYGGANRLCDGSYYPKLLEHMQSLRGKIAGPVMPMLPGWENHRRWTAGAYFPVYDAARAAGVIGRLRQENFHPLVYLSGLNCTYQNEGRDGGDVPGWERYVDSFVIDAASGKPKTYLLDETAPGKDNVWKRHSYQFCPAAPGTKEFFRAVIDQLHAVGIDTVQMDQTTGGGGDACFSAAHGHAPGRGVYQTQAFRQLLADLRRHGKALTPDFMLAHEEPHEELIQDLDAFHTREFRERWWYRSAPGARGIPLFTYLYHEFAIAYGGEGPAAGAAKNPLTVRDMAVNLVTGKTPAVSVWSNQQAMAEAHADQLKMLRNHMSLLKTEARRFLILGRMLHPLEFDVPTVTLQLGVAGPAGWRLEPFNERAVLTSSWQSPEGRVGYCFVNITDQKQALQVVLDARGAAGWHMADIDCYRGESAERQSLYRNAALPQPQALALEPLEAVFVVLRPVP